MPPLLVVVCGYLLGSIPFGYLIVRANKRTDVRQTGSGGTGATNVARSAGKAAGIATLALDAAKGFLAMELARQALAQELAFSKWWVGATAIAALLGHIFPIWLRFHGGKGVATGLGIFLYLSPPAVALSAVIFLALVVATRYVSLGSTIAALTFPLWLWLIHRGETQWVDFAPLFFTAALGSLMIVAMHHANIRRLLAGTENKLK